MKAFETLDRWRYAQWPEGLLLKRRIVGCEIDVESCYIAMKRMDWGRKQVEEEDKQLTLFDAAM